MPSAGPVVDPTLNPTLSPSVNYIPPGDDAAGVAYDNADSGLAAEDVQAAIDEVAASLVALSGDPQFFVPISTGTVAIVATGQDIAAFVNPAGTIAAATLTLPTGTFKGQRCSVNFTQIVTTLTLTATNFDTKGLAAPTAATAVSTFEFVWDSVSTKWNRVR